MSSEPMPLISSCRIGETAAASDARVSEAADFPTYLRIAGLWLGLIAWAMVGVMWSPL